MARSASVFASSAGIADAGSSGITDVLLLFAGTGSVVPLETFAVFESVVGDDAAGAVIVIEIAGAAPTASVGGVQVTVPAAKPQVQPVPDALVKPTPAGNVSLTETLDATPGPLFVTESV